MIDPEDEHVPGAAAAARATVARQYAFQRIAAQLDDTAAAVKVVDRGALYAGLTLAEVDDAELEVRRVYLNEAGGQYLLAVARSELALLHLPAPDGPGPDAEDHHHSDGTPL